jgi:3-phosphoshikimate 1-carboxyvinyltransferase
MIVHPARGIAGAARLPGDKSVSHRYAILAAVASGRTRLENFSTAVDCAHTLACLRELGASVEVNGGAVEIESSGLRSPAAPLDCDNSGSTMRMLAGILAAQPFASELVGDASLSRRPMQRVAEPLARMGAQIETREGFPPLRIHGAPLRGIDYHMPVPSAQVKTAVLFAGLHAEGVTTVTERVRTRDHGELALRAFGADVERARGTVRIAGGQQLHAIEATIPGDISSAAFFLCAAALLPESNLLLDGVLMNPTRAAILDVLVQMGARISVIDLEERHGELVGQIKAERGELRGASVSGAQTTLLIDELPVLAAIAPYTTQGIEIRDAGELRVKESDRLAAIAANLRALGAEVQELADGLQIPGGQRLRGGRVDAHGDHRIAMAFAVAALAADGPTEIAGAECVDISFPGFFDLLANLLER